MILYYTSILTSEVCTIISTISVNIVYNHIFFKSNHKNIQTVSLSYLLKMTSFLFLEG